MVDIKNLYVKLKTKRKNQLNVRNRKKGKISK